MRNFFAIIAVLAVGMASLSACGKQTPDDGAEGNEYVPVTLTKAESGISAKANEFGFNVYHALYEDNQMLISPLSLSLALAMTACGADGDTEAQMTSTLGFNDYTSEEVAGYYKKVVDALKSIDNKTVFEIANSIWISKYLNVKKDFVSTVRDNFSSEERTVDFSDPKVVGQINKWCSDNTHGKVSEIVKDMSPDTAMALVNALYFNGRWGGFTFNEKTAKEDFRTLRGGTSKVDMMSAHAEFTCSFNDGWSMINLPYGNYAFRMSVILPPEDMDFREAAASLNAGSFRNLQYAGRPYSVNLKMPQFKYNYSVDELREALEKLGMKDAFSSKANFSKMADIPAGDALYIGTVKHKTFIDVTTKGTEAAAVTYVGMKFASAAPPSGPVDFIVDRPFFYVISEGSTGAILFIGQKTE